LFHLKVFPKYTPDFSHIYMQKSCI